MTRKISIITAILSIALCYGLTYAGNREVKALTTADGLSDMLVNVIYKDSIGFVWFGTESALDRYDGNNIKTFHFPDEQQGSQRVKAIAETRRDRIYVGNHQGLFTMTSATQQLERICADKITFPVNALAHDGKGTLWIGTRQGLFNYDTRRNALHSVLLGADILSQDNEVTGLCIDPDGTGVWIASLFSLHHYDFASRKITDYKSPEQGPVMMLTCIGDTLYLGTRGSGVIPFSRRTCTYLPRIDFGNDIITSLCPDNDGNLVAVTDGEGIFGYSPTRQKVTYHLKASNSTMRSNSVYATYVDNNGLMWIGYYQGGVDYTIRSHGLFDIYNYPGVIDTHDYEVRALAIDGQKKLIGTRDGLYYIDEGSGKTAIFRKPQMESNIIFCITEWNNLFYIGTYGGGIYVFNPVDMSLRPFAPAGVNFEGQIGFDITVDRHNDMWIAASTGLYRFHDGNLVAKYDATNSRLPEGNVYDIFFDSAGRGWISAENGMAIWDGETLRTDRFPRGFINGQKIRDVYEDRDHNLYFAPDRGEVFKSNFELTKFGPISLNIKGFNVITTFIAEDNDGWVWFGTDKGLIRHDRKNKFQLFNNADGLPGLVFTLCRPYKDRNGDIWMGNTQGLLRLDFSKLKQRPTKLRPQLFVTEITSNGHSILTRIEHGKDGRVLTLGNGENDMAVSFSNFDYISPEYCSVEYILEGFEDEWRLTDGKHPIHYYDLPAGDYTLRLRQAGDTSTETALRIQKRTGMAGTMTNIILISAIVCVGLVAYFLLRHRHQVLHGHTDNAGEDSDDTSDKKKMRYKTTRLSDEECKRLTKTLDSIMRTSKPYKNPNLKIGDLAPLAGTSAHALSFLFNQYMQKSYYDYVNGYRVEEFKRIVKETDISKYTLTAMSQMCGFSSRASFFRHFKAITGITPAEYLKR